MNNSIETKLHFVNELPALDPKTCLLLYDKVLQKNFPKWIKRFPRRLAFASGEKLKNIRFFPAHMSKIASATADLPRQQLKIVVFGGGSLGDFGGFAASVLRRGVAVIQVPSTWLAAMDSAHGGKTALNLDGAKNQIGSFHFASETYLVKRVLLNVPEKQLQSSLGEFYKMALIQGGGLWIRAKSQQNPNAKFLWEVLPEVIAAKMRIVRKDPFEEKGLRQNLNLGHTVGHVLEAELKLPHGVAVLFGLLFSYNWGQALGITDLGQNKLNFFDQDLLKKYLRQIKSPEKFLKLDKKVSSSREVRYVFIRKPGKMLVKKVLISDLIKEWLRQCK